MSTRYEQADESIHEMAREVMEKHHDELRLPPRGPDEEPSHVRLCIMLAWADDDSEPAVKCHGYPAAAVISVIPYKQRVDKRADAEIVIDGEKWGELTERQRRALLDHEITHLEIQTEDVGGVKTVKTDDEGRPKLKLKLHDFDFGGFRSIARRYGDDAPEVILAKQFEEDFGRDVLGRSELFGVGQ